MATTSIWAVKGWLGKVVLYVLLNLLEQKCEFDEKFL